MNRDSDADYVTARDPTFARTITGVQGPANPRANEAIHQLAVASIIEPGSYGRATRRLPEIDIATGFSGNDVFTAGFAAMWKMYAED